MFAYQCWWINKKLNHHQTIANGFWDCISADAFHLFCSPHSVYLHATKACSDIIGQYYYVDYKWNSEHSQYQKSCPIAHRFDIISTMNWCFKLFFSMMIQSVGIRENLIQNLLYVMLSKVTWDDLDRTSLHVYLSPPAHHTIFTRIQWSVSSAPTSVPKNFVIKKDTVMHYLIV